MADLEVSRRDVLQGGFGAAALRLGLGGTGTMAALLAPVTPAMAKPGGHRVIAGYCRAKFEIDRGGGAKDEFILNLVGGGYASFDNVYDYSTFNIKDAVTQSTLSMQWESSYHFSNSRPELGLVTCKTLVRGKSNTRSGIIIVSDRARGIFPATMVNTLFFEMHFANLGLTIFNKDPLVLRGNVQNLTSAMLNDDPRVRANPKGIAAEMVPLLNPDSQESFNPVGTHTLQSPNVEFYDKNRPDVRIAVNTESVVQTMPHYGLDIRVADLSIEGQVVTLVWSITNLVWDPARPEPQDIVWVVDDSHDLRIVGDRQGRVRIGGDPVLVRVQAVNTSTDKPLMPAAGQPETSALQQACLFCQAQNMPTGLDARDLISGFAYVDVAMMRQHLRTRRR